MQVLTGQATQAVGHRPAIQQEPSPSDTINRCYDTDGAPMSELVVVCVPGVQLNNDRAVLRVVLTPRLTGPGTTIHDYGLETWPQAIQNAQFEVRLRPNAGGTVQAFPTTCRTDIDPAVWSGFFGPQFTVKPHAGQQSYSDPIVDATTAHAERIEAGYQAAAVAIADPAVVKQQYQQLDLNDPRPPLPSTAPLPTFVQPDFHRTLAMLREHPRVLRALGMIVDLTVPRAALDATGTTGEISAGWLAAPAGLGAVVSPWTAYETTTGRFLPLSAGTVTGGMVNLRSSTDGQPDWVVTTIDVDSAVARLSDAKAIVEEPGSQSPATLPSLRTIGLMLMHRRHGDWLAARAAQARDHAATLPLEQRPAMTAEALVLGYRLDVRPRGDEWHSLTRRQATYTVAGHTIGTAAAVEEAHTKPAAVVKRPDHLLTGSEAVARWDGWSLAVPREPLVPSGPAPARKQPLPYDFDWVFTLDDTGPPIPELRFGSGYFLRARVVDLAGEGLALNEPTGDSTTTDLVAYGRLEPIGAPVIPPPEGLLVGPADETGSINHALLGPGGAVDVMVIRSDPRGTPATLVATYPANDRRTLLPPSMTFTLADQHGVLDDDDQATWDNAQRALAPPTPRASEDAGTPAYSWLPDTGAKGVTLAPLWLEGDPATFIAQRDWEASHWPNYAAKSLTLVGTPGTFVLADWPTMTEGRVALPAGRQVSLEVSSYIQDDFLDRFAVDTWISGHEDAVKAANAGRHPIVTPPHKMLLVHAVRRPLNAPQGALVVSRTPGATAATLSDPQQPFYAVDRDSTIAVDVSAAWDEWTDAPEPTPMNEVLQTLPVARTTARLPDIHHEFGDTRHRRITYTLTARSRYRQYFDDAEPEEAFSISSPTAAVDVLCTARPAPPRILSVVPAFSWETRDDGTAITRIRHGGRLRVELARPWYTTGQGEVLAVITAPDAAGVANLAPSTTADWAFLTAAYRDPLTPARPLSHQPTASAFTETAGPSAVVRDLESTRDVTVVPYPVWYSGGRRFADIVVTASADASYSPLMALSLARYQPSSLKGLSLSTLVRTDYVPLMPTRTLTITRGGGSVVVKLAGVGFLGGANRVDIRLEARTGPAPALGQDVSNELTAVAVADGSLGWRGISSTQTTLGAASSAITLPNPGTPYRLVVRELETLAPSSAPAAGPLPADDPLVQRLSERAVFADVVVL